MNTRALAAAIRRRARLLRNADQQPPTMGQLSDDAELLCVLARVVEGKPLKSAFGAPGDWGYSTPIGAALAEVSEETPACPA
jgi:hypothetical protein